MLVVTLLIGGVAVLWSGLAEIGVLTALLVAWPFSRLWRLDARALRERFARYPVPIGHLGHWVVDKASDARIKCGVLRLVLREHRDVVRSAVNFVEPGATCCRLNDTTLEVHVPWDDVPSDMDRLDRLVLFLAMHRDELGLERIELAPHS